MITVRSTAILLLLATALSAGQKSIQIDTVPPGVQVELNGSIVCAAAPCQVQVPDYYFGRKRTLFAAHASQPIRVRLTKEGFVPRSVEIGTGPIRWHSLNGVKQYDYYLLETDRFTFELDAINTFLTSNSPPTAPDQKPPGSQALSNSQIVQMALPAMVVVSTPDGWGSGFFVTPEGLIATSRHVVGHHTAVAITLGSGKSVQSTQVYVDENRDLALIKIPAESAPILKISSQVPDLGSEVIAIGSPSVPLAGSQLIGREGNTELSNTVTKGIVSGIRQGDNGQWIQTDVALNHGNSGGPLLNMNGEVVGINTLGFSPAGLTGVNFALGAYELSQVLSTTFRVQANRPPAITPASPGSGKAKTDIFRNSDVLTLKSAGISDQLLIEAIDNAQTIQFDLDAAHLISLHQAGLSDGVIAEMLRRAKSQ